MCRKRDDRSTAASMSQARVLQPSGESIHIVSIGQGRGLTPDMAARNKAR